ncbi:MAG: glycosyltransferase family 9 protein [Desulfarculaceae bacterium]|nr:glycosyltransferase family 9 protein [Desulfarculaceae bacterium]
MSVLAGILNPLVLGRLRDDPGPFDPARVKSILVVRNDNIGDVLCTTPAIQALREAFPRAHLAAMVCTLSQQAIEGHPALDELLVYPKAKHKHFGALESYQRMGAMLRAARARRFDLAVAFRDSFSPSQAWLAYASGARWRLGPEARGKRKRLGFYYNLPAPWPPKDDHEVLRCMALLRYIGLDSQPGRLYLEIPQASKDKVAEFLVSCGLDPARPPVVLNITRWAYRPECTWPDEKYRRLAGELARRPEGLIVTHAPGDKEWVSGILSGLKPEVPVFASPSLKDFAAAIAAGRAFITPEGGPMHFAAAVHRPLVVMWSSTPLCNWRPWGVPCEVLGATGPIAPITVEELLAALERLPASPLND